MVTALAPALGLALAVAAASALAEWLHGRRVARIARLAFGPSGRPAAWARLAPAIRVLAMGLATLGAWLCLRHDPVEVAVEPSPRAAQQLLVVLDVSPSMNLADAGPASPRDSRNSRIMRGVRAGEVLRGILDRLDMQDTRVSLIACYSDAVPMLRDSTDKDLVSGLMDGLPLYTAFKPGETDLQAGIDEAFAMAKGWARRSTTLVVISDGDLSKPVNPGPRPASIADALVIGVGDPNRATDIAGHASRQDAWTLKSLAARLDGRYHDGNARHLPREVLDSLTMISPRVSDALGLREIGLASLAAGATLLAFLGPLLQWFGVPRPARPVAASPDSTRPDHARLTEVPA